MSPRISLSEGKEYVLALSTRKYNINNSHDTISVVLFDEEGNGQYEIIKKEIDAQDSWKRYSIEIPHNHYRFTIGIIFDIDYRSVMYIDNITISEKPIGTGVISTSRYHNEESPLSVYSLMGLKYQNKKSGINIIKMSNGSYKKIYIK